VKKTPVKRLRLVREPNRVLTTRELVQVAGGGLPTTSDACPTTKGNPSVQVTDTCG
jgi:hypothetical protein